MSRSRLVVGAALLVLVAMGAVSGAALGKGKGPTVVSANCHGHNFKPGRIVLACGDAGLFVEHLDWTQWGRSEARGTGVGTGETCKPDCATGGTKSAGMEVRLFQPRYCSQDGRVHFTKMRYRWTEGSPISGTPDSGVVPSPCAAV
jgi:hypothetical protein